MTLYEFKLFDEPTQAQYAWDNGALIGFREEGKLYMILYQLERFYVEIQYYTDLHEIASIKSFISNAPLQPYLETIDITELLK